MGASEFADPRFAFRIAEVDGELVGFVKLGPIDLPVETERAGAPSFTSSTCSKRMARARASRDDADGLGDRRGAAPRRATSSTSRVFIDNHRARRFYERYGFEAVGRYDFMVGNQADEDIIMRQAL